MVLVFHQNGLSTVSARLIAPGSRLVGFGPTRCLITPFRQYAAYGLSVGFGPIRQIHQALGGRVSRSVVGEIVKRVRHPS